MTVLNANHKIILDVDGEDEITLVPATYTFSIQGVDFESGRVASGEMERNMIGEKRKCQIGTGVVHSDKIRQVLKAINGTSKQEFKATIVDPTSDDGYYTGTFYCGDRSMESYSWGIDLWNNLTFDIIEV